MKLKDNKCTSKQMKCYLCTFFTGFKRKNIKTTGTYDFIDAVKCESSKESTLAKKISGL